MVGAGALSIWKLKYAPNTIVVRFTIHAIHSMLEKRFTNKNAIAPGAISKLIAKIRPIALSVATIVSERKVSKV